MKRNTFCKLGPLLVLLIPLMGCSPVERPQVRVSLHYTPYPERHSYPLPDSICDVEPCVTLPEGDWVLPELHADTPVYAVLPLADTSRLTVFDQVDSSSTTYDRIWFDANGNQDLTDDAPLDGYDERHLLECADCLVRLDDASLRYRLSIAASRPQLQEWVDGTFPEELQPFAVRYRSNCYYAGAIRLGSERYEFMFSDYNVNGRFGDEPAGNPDPYSGRLHIEGDKLCFLTKGKYDIIRDVFFADYLGIADALFKVDLDLKNEEMTLTRVHEGLGLVELPIEVELFTLISRDGTSTISLFKQARSLSLPEGEYRVLSYQAVREVSSGDIIRLWGVGAEDSTCTQVRSDKPSVLEFGPPYTPVVSIPPASVKPLADGTGEVVLVFHMEGRGGDRPFDYAYFENADAQTPYLTDAGPTTFQVFGPDGLVATQNGFAQVTAGSYGHHGSIFEGWAVWKGARRGVEYTITCKFPLDGYETKSEVLRLVIP